MLSVALIGRNEASNVARALESVRHYAAEIIFVDTGSTDSTKEIVAGYGAKIIDLLWADDFSAARNVALQQCAGQWILSIDCDEALVSNGDINKFFDSLKYDSESVAYAVPIHSVLQDDHRDTHVDVRLFRNRLGIVFCNPIHESVTPSIYRLYPNITVATAPVSIDHCGYSSSEKNKHKLIRNQNILLKWTEAEPENPYAWYKLGLTLKLTATQYSAACLFKSFELLLAREDRNSFAFRFDLVRSLLDSLQGSDRALESVVKSEFARAFS